MKNISVEEFMKKKEKEEIKRSISFFHDDIVLLRRNGYTLKCITEYLSLNGLNTTISNISQYLKRQTLNDFKNEKV